MWSLPTGTTFLPEVSTKQLRALYAAEQHPKSKLRLLAATHRRAGKSIDEIAYMLSKPRRTVHGWLTRFAERGVTAKDSIKQSGRPPVLTVKQRRELIKLLERGPPRNPSGLWSTKQVKDVLNKNYGVTYVHQHVWRLLTSLGFSMQRPRKQHYKRPDEKELKRFKKKRDDKHSTTAAKGLLWARKMKRHSASSPSSRAAGRDGARAPS